MSDQRVEQTWETPSLEEIPVITKMHVEAMESSDDPMVWSQAGMHHVLIRTVGRRSGNEHKVALPYWRDSEGHRIVVASFAGAKAHPSWYFNVADKEANPELLITEEGRQFWVVADICEGDDYQATWDGLVADRAWYADYQAKAPHRQIPLVRLVEQRPA